MKATHLILFGLGIGIFGCTKEELITGTFTDARDGHVYNTIQIGTQIWMSENLAYLPYLYSPANAYGQRPNYWVYGYSGNDSIYVKTFDEFKTYGVLYDFTAAIAACPSGWHLPRNKEWQILFDYLANNGYGYSRKGTDIAKSLASSSRWKTYDEAGTIGNDQASNNSSGFNAMPGGDIILGEFNDRGLYTTFWTFSPNYNFLPFRDTVWKLSYGSDEPTQFVFPIFWGFSVRCVKDIS